MKAITIKQPWASLIVHGIKDIENRTWKTNFRGRILVHAGAQRDNSAKLMLTDEEYELFGGVINYCGAMLGAKSSIIGSVEIVDCVRNHRSEWSEKEDWNWVLANPILFEEPITEVKGRLGLWNYEMDTKKEVSYGKKEVEYECTNNNSSGLNEYKEGCRQHCDDLLPTNLMQKDMNSLQKKALKRASELLKQFDTYEIYKAVNNSIATIEDKELNRNIIDSYQNAMSHEAKKISEALSWIDEVLNNE